jgi:hypothetical protein
MNPSNKIKMTPRLVQAAVVVVGGIELGGVTTEKFERERERDQRSEPGPKGKEESHEIDTT